MTYVYDPKNLTIRERQLRSTIRAFILTANRAEMEKEREISLERKDNFRAAVIAEAIAEVDAGKW